jgi:hypothetical protein
MGINFNLCGMGDIQLRKGGSQGASQMLKPIC